MKVHFLVTDVVKDTGRQLFSTKCGRRLLKQPMGSYFDAKNHGTINVTSSVVGVTCNGCLKVMEARGIIPTPG